MNMTHTASISRYSSVAIALHWILAIAILTQLTLGFFHDSWPREERGAVIGLHKSLGLTILVLSLLRLGWRLTHKPPPLPAGLAPWEKTLSQAVHWGFYVVMIGAPLGGWAMSSASPRNRPIDFWGLFEWPKLPLPRSEALTDQLHAGHLAAGYVAVALFALHVVGALKHQFFDQNRVLWRMIPFLRAPER